MGTRTLIIAGLATESCVLVAATEAHVRDFKRAGEGIFRKQARFHRPWMDLLITKHKKYAQDDWAKLISEEPTKEERKKAARTMEWKDLFTSRAAFVRVDPARDALQFSSLREPGQDRIGDAQPTGLTCRNQTGTLLRQRQQIF